MQLGNHYSIGMLAKRFFTKLRVVCWAFILILGFSVVCAAVPQHDEKSRYQNCIQLINDLEKLDNQQQDLVRSLQKIGMTKDLNKQDREDLEKILKKRERDVEDVEKMLEKVRNEKANYVKELATREVKLFEHYGKRKK